MTSNINPNNIDGAYPVAGQDNNSQGFRDNFTNTKTNFQYAAAEITDLQQNAILKSALSGTTLDNNMNGSILSNFQGQNISSTVVSLGTLSGDVGINYTAGPYQTVTTSGAISLAFTNFTVAGTQDTVYVQVTVTSVAHTLQLPSAVGSGASATSLIGIQGLDTMTNTITFPATGTYVYSFTTTDSGTTIYLNDLTQSRGGFLGNISATGNVTGGNIVSNAIVSRYMDVEAVNYANITATNTYSLSNTSSINVLIANNTGYTATLNMPTSPIDGQICNFAVHGNTVTLAVGTGTVLPTFAGSTAVGTGYRYIYSTSNTSWYRIG